MQAQDIFGELLIAFQARIADKVPEIKYVNQDLGQLEVYTMDRPGVSWPCLLIDFNDTSYSDLGNMEQEGELNLLCRLGFNPFSQTSNLQPEDVRKKGLYYYALEAKVHAALHGWQPMFNTGVQDDDGNDILEPLCQPLSRRRGFTEKREEDAFRVRGLAFTTGFNDDGASPVRTTITPRLDILFEELED